MTSKRYPLTNAVIAEICALIREGAFEHVAVESLGIPYTVFQGWIEAGQRDDARPLQKRLCDEVLKAKAATRLEAETEMRREQPRHWLLHGPGKETSERPGWTTPAKSDTHKLTSKTEAWNAEVVELVSAIDQALESYPEAREVVIRAIRAFPAKGDTHEDTTPAPAQVS